MSVDYPGSPALHRLPRNNSARSRAYRGNYPPAWEYLAARQHDSFYTSMTLIDAVGGYEVDADLYYEPRVRRALVQAGTASVMVNDLHSVAKDAVDDKPVCNMVLQIAADRQCSVQEAVAITVDLHDNLVALWWRRNASEPLGWNGFEVSESSSVL